MATIRSCFSRVDGRSGTGGTAQAFSAIQNVRVATISTGPSPQTLQSGGQDFVAPFDGFWNGLADGPIDAMVGSEPSASATVGFPIHAGVPFARFVAQGQKISVVDG